MRPSDILSAAVLCSSVAAWPSFRSNSLGAALEEMILPHKRAPQAITLGDDSAASANPTQATITSQTASVRQTGTTATQTGTNAGTNSRTGTNSGTTARQTTGTDSSATTTSGDSSSVTSATTFDPRLPAGGISMITPNPRSSTQYYKIGNYVTFAWNYTSLSVTPSAIDILATCSKNQATYTLAANQTISGPTGSIIWDTKDYQATGTVPLLTETYTLIIHDANEAITTVPKAGYLGTFAQFTFGMYVPQNYVPLDQFVCVTCSGALGSLERHSLATVGIMAAAAVLGGTWFVGGASALF